MKYVLASTRLISFARSSVHRCNSPVRSLCFSTLAFIAIVSMKKRFVYCLELSYIRLHAGFKVKRLCYKRMGKSLCHLRIVRLLEIIAGLARSQR